MRCRPPGRITMISRRRVSGHPRRRRGTPERAHCLRIGVGSHDVRAEEGQHEAVVLGEIHLPSSTIQGDGDGGRGGPLEALDHEGHLVLHARAAIVLVVDPQAVELLDGEEVGELPRGAVAGAQVIGYDGLLVLILTDGQLEAAGRWPRPAPRHSGSGWLRGRSRCRSRRERTQPGAARPRPDAETPRDRAPRRSSGGNRGHFRALACLGAASPVPSGPDRNSRCCETLRHAARVVKWRMPLL